MTWFINAVLVGHYMLITLLCVFGLHRLLMVYRWWRLRHVRPQEIALPTLPRVTLQLPVFNESNVVERLIDTVAALDYPRDLLDIQVLDDSTDETRDLVHDRVAYWREQGLDISHLHRSNRSGFKAGALAAGLESARGEFIAVLDADFLPQADLLRRALPYFSADDIGMVQLRWEHLNRRSGFFTELQAVLLDSHFMIEQAVRAAGGFMFNFNGTAGIWRRTAIIDAGNWQGDTLTEDMDLSYRAQLRGWRFVYLADQSCPGELPAGVNAFKRQQHRWAKGAIQVGRKLLLRVWRAGLPLHQKIEASFHMLGNFAYLLMLIDATVFLLPSILLRADSGLSAPLWLDLTLFAFAGLAHILFFLAGQWARGVGFWRSLILVPGLMLLAVALAVNNARAVMEALLGMRSDFIRTPKSGASAAVTSRPARKRYRADAPGWELMELALGLAYGLAMLLSVQMGLWWALPFMLLLHAGFFCSGYASLRERRT